MRPRSTSCAGAACAGPAPLQLQHCVPCGCLAEHAMPSSALPRLPPLACRGYNDEGALGNGSNFDSLEPVPVLGGLAFADIAAGSGHTCGLLNNGSVACWVGASGWAWLRAFVGWVGRVE